MPNIHDIKSICSQNVFISKTTHHRFGIIMQQQYVSLMKKYSTKIPQVDLKIKLRNLQSYQETYPFLWRCDP